MAFTDDIYWVWHLGFILPYYALIIKIGVRLAISISNIVAHINTFINVVYLPDYLL